MPGRPVPVRTVQPLEVPDHEHEVDESFYSNAVEQLKSTLKQIRMMVDDRSRPVDEYNSTTTSAETVLEVTVQPQYDKFSARIESVIVVAPPASIATLTLGDRTWNLVIPASGILVMAPVGLLLSRNDTRRLAVTVAGDISLELMGFADVRY